MGYLRAPSPHVSKGDSRISQLEGIALAHARA